MATLTDWLPKSVVALRGYDQRCFTSDLLAGITVGLVALPLAMAFAISSGVPPQAGLYCAVVAGFLISALGGSRCQIGGPTGAFVVVVSGIVAHHGLDGLYLCTIMAGVMLWRARAAPADDEPGAISRVPGSGEPVRERAGGAGARQGDPVGAGERVSDPGDDHRGTR
jgi:sulfate permease family protein